jgi:hypothetical protein
MFSGTNKDPELQVCSLPCLNKYVRLTNTLGSYMSGFLSLDLGFLRGFTLQGGILFHLEQ